MAPVFQIGSVSIYNSRTGATASALVATGINFTQFWQLFPDRLVFENGSLPDQNQNDALVLGHKPNHPNDAQAPFAYPNDNITITLTGPIPSKFNFTVAGTLQKRGTSGLGNFDYWAFLSIEKAREIGREIYGVGEGAHLIFVKVADPEHSEQVADQIEELFHLSR